jgi:hypothetical protein
MLESHIIDGAGKYGQGMDQYQAVHPAGMLENGDGTSKLPLSS